MRDIRQLRRSRDALPLGGGVDAGIDLDHMLEEFAEAHPLRISHGGEAFRRSWASTGSASSPNFPSM
jgi:hypothetical protein